MDYTAALYPNLSSCTYFTDGIIEVINAGAGVRSYFVNIAAVPTASEGFIAYATIDNTNSWVDWAYNITSAVMVEEKGGVLWKPDTEYVVGDIVIHDDDPSATLDLNAYKCIKDHKSPPTWIGGLVNWDTLISDPGMY
jgi:hypothetical protein